MERFSVRSVGSQCYMIDLHLLERACTGEPRPFRRHGEGQSGPLMRRVCERPFAGLGVHQFDPPAIRQGKLSGVVHRYRHNLVTPSETVQLFFPTGSPEIRENDHDRPVSQQSWRGLPRRPEGR